jgi:biotin carboxyl carrier protein
MRYYVHLSPGEAPVTVDVTELPNGALDVKVDDRKVDVDILPVGGALSLRVGGQVVDLTVEGTPPDLGAIASGHRSYVRVESDRSRAADRARKGGAKAHEKLVRSPMPGRVIKVVVAPGDVVEAGAPLLVVEAMKMENEIKAKATGKVAGVHVSVGDAVEGNARLVSFE